MSLDSDNRLAKMDMFVPVYVESGLNISAACRKCGITFHDYQRWCDNYPKFAERLQDAERELVDIIEAKAWAKAVGGDDKWMERALANHKRHKWNPVAADAPPAIQITIVDGNVTKLDGAVDAKTS
jgi:hypothetical protein